jgi:hypothetical protein
MVPNITKGVDTFQSTDFLKTYQRGGLFLLDELDAADANVLLAINTALANGYIEVPKGRIEVHSDFVLVATANTFGTGNSRTFAGRNQLDAATLDRFHIGTVECDYDQNVERALCPNSEALVVFWEVRKAIGKLGVRKVISTRFIQDSYLMMSQCSWTIPECLTGLLGSWTPMEFEKLLAALPSSVQGAVRQSRSGSF